MYTLCVVDMQGLFQVTNTSETTINVAREIRQAMRDGAAIIFVEYATCGDTLSCLTDIPKEAVYPLVRTAVKKWDDGSREVIKTIRDNTFPIDHIKVVGVNTDACVYYTVLGLKGDLPKSKIEVIADACNSVGYDGHDRGICNIRKLGCTILNYNPAVSTPAL